VCTAADLRSPSATRWGHGDTFDMRRSNATSYLTFGFGAHTCMGNNLARVELRILVEELTRRFPDLSLVPDQGFTFPDTSQRGPQHVRIRWPSVPASSPARASVAAATRAVLPRAPAGHG
jgi:cytochrome P450